MCSMTRFLVQTLGVKPLIAVIATHGLTDLDSPRWVAAYAVAMTVPLPSPVVTGVFCAASVGHFAYDVGKRGSVAVHTGVLCAGLVGGTQAAFRAMIAYLAVVHVPMHYLRCVLRKRRQSALAVACASAVAMALSGGMGEWVPLTDGMQRAATAHIVTEAWANRR